MKKVVVVAGSAALLMIVAGIGPVSSQTSGETDFPLAEFPGFGHDPEADEARYYDEEGQRENLIARCMGRQGFRYTATRSIVVTDRSVDPDEMWQLVQDDPNNRYFASLSKERRRQYSMALAETPSVTHPRAGLGGCIEDSHQAVPGVYAAFNALREPFEQLLADVESHPDVLRAEAAWSKCMAEAGFMYETMDDFHSSVDAAVREGQPPAAVQVAEMRYDEAQDDSLGCIAAAGYSDAWDAAQVTLEREFVDHHREVLESFGP